MAMLLLFVWWGSIPVNFFSTKKNSNLNIGHSFFCFPTIEKLGILQLKPQLTLNPTLFEYPPRLGGMSGGTTESSPASPVPRLGDWSEIYYVHGGDAWNLEKNPPSKGADVWKWWIMWICESSCPENVKLCEAVKEFFLQHVLLGGGFKALHWTFWWDSHTLGSSSSIWAMGHKGQRCIDHSMLWRLNLLNCRCLTADI